MDFMPNGHIFFLSKSLQNTKMRKSQSLNKSHNIGRMKYYFDYAKMIQEITIHGHIVTIFLRQGHNVT